MQSAFASTTPTSAATAPPDKSCQPSRVLKETCGPDDDAREARHVWQYLPLRAYPNIVAAVQHARSALES